MTTAHVKHSNHHGWLATWQRGGSVVAAQARQMRWPTCLVLCSDSRFGGALQRCKASRANVTQRPPPSLVQQPSSRESVPWRPPRLACQSLAFVSVETDDKTAGLLEQRCRLHGQHLDSRQGAFIPPTDEALSPL
ncbi:hypothetical protein CDD82_388 [Ophiocordyceps australis]|uniref:Uncharacterized protein n=1 Tax=Ophiocordyceps australis TaxID=1399860 RepID=A0A2C5ZKK2_9HYPO|nr:hypothetical protein CDD82_388 [Ophiocordyceps australis]